MTFNKFWVLLACFIVLFIFFLIILCEFMIRKMIKKTSWKYDYDNNHELEPVGLLKNGVLQVLSSWENQTVLQCLKHHRKNCFTFNIFWELKMESFGEASSKKTCFSLYMEKGKLFIQLFWPLGFTMLAKKNYFRRISVTMNKNLVKSDVVKHELGVESL